MATSVKGTVSLKTLVENEASFIGRIPLNKFKSYLEKQANEGIVTVDFHANGYITDAVLRVLRDVLCNKAKRDRYLAELTTVDLTGCFNVTDTGIGWVAEIVKLAPKFSMVYLDGCVSVTDSGLAAILNAKPSITVSAIATSVMHINLDSATQGCPLLVDPKYSYDHTNLTYGHSVIVPQPELETSFAEYLWKKENGSRNGRQLCHVKDWSVKNWTLALNEMELSNPLFDILVPGNPSQVLIPFNANTDIREIRYHIANTISRVLNKERTKPLFVQKKVVKRNQSKFMDIHHYSKLEMSFDGLIKSVSKSGGIYASRQPLSRSNPYYEVTCVKVIDGGTDLSLVIGCMFDTLFKTTQPSYSSSATSSATEKFELREGDVMGFGVTGEWESEYIPREDGCSFYFIRNGYLVLDAVTKNLPRVGMYPLLTVLGKGQAHIQLNNFNAQPSTTKKGNFEAGHAEWLLCDEEGVLSLGMDVKTDGGLCVNKLPITKSNPSCTISVLEEGVGCRMSLGLGRENVTSRRLLGTGDDTLGLRSEDGKVYYQGKLASQEGSSENRRWKKGDEVTISVSGFEDELIKSGETVKVEFSIGGTKVAESMYKFSSTYGNRCAFLITLHSNGAKVKIQNFSPPYYPWPPVKDKLTMGRCNQLKVQEDGTLQPIISSSTITGFYMSKTPVSKFLSYFEMEVKMATKGHPIAIGLCTWHHHMDKKIGLLPGSTGFEFQHESVAKVFNNVDSGVNPESKPKVETGDVIGCGIEVRTTKFKSDGGLLPQQILDVYYTLNGVKVHESKFSYWSNGLYPCVTLHTHESMVKLHNFYPACFSPEDLAKAKETTGKKTTEEEAPKWTGLSEGCQFVIVSVGSGSGDEKAKLQQVKSQLNLEQDLSLTSKLKTEIQQLEKDLDALDFQGQNYYSRLCWNLECLERVCHHKDRLHFMSVNVKTGEGYDNLLDKIIDLHEDHKTKYPLQYHIHTYVKNGLDKIASSVTTKGILRKVDDMARIALGSNNLVFSPAVRLLHGMGRVLYLKLNSEVYAVDLNYLIKVLLEPLNQLNEKKMKKDKRATSVGEETPLWSWDGIFTSKGFVKVGELHEVQKYLSTLLGLVRLPLLRTQPQDQQGFWTPIERIVSANTSMSDYWSKGNRPADTVMIWRTYQFLAGMPTHILSTVITLCSQYARLQLVRKDGGVLQSGAVQTTVVQHTYDKAESLTIESKCLVPDSDKGPINDNTRYHVEEYTWNVFCILADIIDGHLENCGLTPIIKQNLPSKFGKTSVGCKHDWSVSEAEIIQSICTLCELCCDLGRDCKWNGIVGHYLRQCQCGTKVTGCKSCGICKRCAQQLWIQRSILRPCCEVSCAEHGSSEMLTLNGTTFNEVEFIKIQPNNQPICLKRQEDSSETLIQMFPGTATEIKELQKLFDYNKRTSFSKTLQAFPGDTITITLHTIKQDPAKLLESGDEEEAILDIKPVYISSICREARVWHETGIVCYDSQVNKMGQFIAAKPLGEDCKRFSVGILCGGRQMKICIALVDKQYITNKTTDWSSGFCSYHATDGKIYRSNKVITSGEKLKEGSTMTCELDLQAQTVTFYHGENKVFTTEQMNIPVGGLFPMVGLYSDGEAVRLLELDPWQPPVHGETLTDSDAFDTYKYANLWISPGRSVYLHKTSVSTLAGWLLLHNPSSDLVGYLVSSEPAVVDYAGQIEPEKSSTIWISNLGSKGTAAALSNGTIEIVWFNLNSGKTYTKQEIKNFLKTLTSEQYHGHLVKIKIDVEQEKEGSSLRKTNTGMKKQDMYELHVKKNDTVLDKYYLKSGSYTCVLPTDENEGGKETLLIRRPKHPTFDYPRGFQRGMRVIAQLENTTGYSEAVITTCSADMQSVTLEVSPKDSDDNQWLDIKPSSKAIQLENVSLKAIEEESETDVEKDGFKDTKGNNSGMTKMKTMKADIKINGYEARGNVSVEKRAYMFPPPSLLTPDSHYAIMALDSKWKSHSLESIGKCDTVPTRITVQELQITELSRKLPNWIKSPSKDRRVDQAFIFLPSSLDVRKLCHSPIPKLFHDIEVHRLCFLAEQLHANHGMSRLTLDVPLHFVDTPPMSPKSPLSVDEMYGHLSAGWTYTALVASKLKLPVYDQVFSGCKPDFSREQVETMLGSLLRIYTAQCHILAEQHGGMDLQESHPRYSDQIEAQISHADKFIQTFHGELFEDSSSLIRHRETQIVYCKGHQLTMDKTHIWDQEQAKELLYEHKYFEPYHETVNYFHRKLPNQQSLPEDFFAKFSNLQFLCLENCMKMKALPAGISKCLNLRGVVFKGGIIKHLPEDLFLVLEMKMLKVTKLPISTLPKNWPASSQLTSLSLSGLQMTKVPPELCKLKELSHLDLSCNPLVDIPHEFRKLQKLKILDLSGMPWLTLTSNRSSVTRDQYRTWCKTHSYVQMYLEKMDMEQMFDDNDLNRNGMLDEEELSALNLELFWKIPRLGSSCITDEEFGGIPPAVFQIASLEELILTYTAITVIPVHMCRLVNLRTLRLENNPLLESLPGSVGHMPNLKHLNLNGCPSLRTPPSEVVSRGFESVKAYLKRLAGGFTACRRTKLMLVGLGGAGKTSLLKALMSQQKKTEGTKGEEITDGIVIQHWKVVAQDAQEISYSAWDFAGQTLYYNTHQFFLSKRAVYLLLWSTRQGFEHAGLDFWLSSIACHAPKTPIFVVATHCDEVPKTEIPTAELMQKYPQIAGFHFVSSTTGTGIAELEKQLLKVTLEQKNMGEKIPQVWLNLEKKILAAREKTSVLPWSEIREYGVDVGLYDEKDNKEAIEFLHELGTVQYFDNEFLRDRVVINPQWIVNVMSCVVSVKNSPIQENKGHLHHKHISRIWNQYPKSLHRWLLQLTEEFDLTFPLPKDPINIVPCLLPPEEPKELNWPSIPKNGDLRQTKMVYKFSYLPAGLFNRAQVRLFQLSDSKLIWKRGSLLKKNNHLALIRQISNFEVVVLVQGPHPENILFLVHEIFESLIDESFHGVVYDFMVPCPDCVMKEGCLEPSMFDSELVYSGRDHKAPFLVCRKYFHTVSMSQLIESMPDAQGGDFDASLQHSIIMLQELNNALTTDVAILYSLSDVPKSRDSGDKIHPTMVKHDLEKMGLSVWFCEDMNKANIQDLTLALKNCKVVVTLVSDNFERDKKCRDLMFYTMDTLHKAYLIIAVGKGMAWQNTDLGMRIGKQELMVMAKTKTRYVECVMELQKTVGDMVMGVKTKGTKARPGSLGWGDPRTIKKQLEDSGVSTWIDHEQMSAGKGLFENITQGMRYAKVLVACVSDEYAVSENCMMELRFGVLNLGLPLVLAVVGTGNEWLYTEAGALAQRAKADRVYLQEQNATAYKSLVQYVRQRLPEKSDTSMRKEAIQQDMTELQRRSNSSRNTVVFKEEYELIQRRFMRHIIMFVSNMDSTPMPRLVIIDFDRTEKSSKVTDSPVRKQTQSSRPGLRPKTASRTRERIEMVNPEEEDWESESLCIRLLCEFEEGWHLCEQSFPLKRSDELHNQMKRVAPYLARIFAILKQSSVQMNCFSGDPGKEFLKWLDRESQGSDFLKAYQAMRAIMTEHEQAAASFLKQLCRCHLPSGKVFWLCETHQSGPRITKLSRDVGIRLNQRKVVLPADVLLKERIEKSDTYQRKRTEKSKVRKIEISPEEKPKPKETVPRGAPTESASLQPPKSNKNFVTSEDKPNKEDTSTLDDKPQQTTAPKSADNHAKSVHQNKSAKVQNDPVHLSTTAADNSKSKDANLEKSKDANLEKSTPAQTAATTQRQTTKKQTASNTLEGKTQTTKGKGSENRAESRACSIQ